MEMTEKHIERHIQSYRLTHIKENSRVSNHTFTYLNRAGEKALRHVDSVLTEKTFESLKKMEEEIRIWNYLSFSRVGGIKIVKLNIPSKAISKFKTISTKSPT